jgi:hypothetical protein
MEDMKLENFSPHLNTKFLLKREPEGAAEAVEMELIEAIDLGSTPRQEQFSIVFRGPLAPQLEQAIYSIEHKELGTFELFIVPFKKGQDGMYYEAVFNRPL